MPDYSAEENLSALLSRVIAVARQASVKILEIYRSDDFDVTTKSDNSPVTRADIAAHTTIVEGLRAITPDLPVLSEEDADINFAERRQWDAYWLVDPLDGTRDFVARSDCFSVNIALIVHNESVLGVIDLPVTGETFYAARTLGSFKATGDGEPVPVHTRDMTGQVPVLIVSGFRNTGRLDPILNVLGEHDLRFSGSSIKSCRVAEGSVDFYPCLGPTSEWDTAAAQIIVEEAGGVMETLEGETLRYNLHESLRNPWFMVYGDRNFGWRDKLPDAVIEMERND